MASPKPPSGLVVIDKPGQMTSHDVVAKVRRALGTRKVGHAGTLDPMATGVLVLGVERATRLLGHLMLTEKTYTATVRLGATTTTDDADGEITATTAAAHLESDDVHRALRAFEGDIDQVPSTVSAIKVDGRRAHALARAGESVVLKARPVTIREISGSNVRADGDFLDLDLHVRCSSGTYIRAIARDLGAALGVGAHLTALRRDAVGPFVLSGANTSFEDLTVTPIAEAARAFFPSVDLSREQAQEVRYGRSLALEIDGLSAVFAPDGEFLALYRPEGGVARPEAVFVG